MSNNKRRLKFIKSFAGVGRSFRRGVEYLVEDRHAVELVARGVAVDLDADPEDRDRDGRQWPEWFYLPSPRPQFTSYGNPSGEPALLSILIPTIDSRERYLKRLLARLLPQVDNASELVEVVVVADNGEVSIGHKRNWCLWDARGDYVAFVDDDDLVSEDYVERIIEALTTANVDCVGFKVKRYSIGQDVGEAIHSLRYSHYSDHTDAKGYTHYQRTPNHLNPVLRGLAMAVAFRDMDNGEDVDYATRLRPLLRSEAYIDAPLYHYLYIPKQARKDTTHELRTQ